MLLCFVLVCVYFKHVSTCFCVFLLGCKLKRSQLDDNDQMMVSSIFLFTP